MSLRLQVTHRSTYTYDSEVVSSYNEARLVPVTDTEQLTLSSRVTTGPDAPQFRYWDYWGTQVMAFDLHVPHASLTVTCTSVVDTADEKPAPEVSWQDLSGVADSHLELLAASPCIGADEQLRALAAEPAGTPYEVSLRLAELVHERVEYVPGSTGVGTSATEAWALGKGVCQDLAHVTVALLRARGIPARYVSGYLHPHTEPAVGEVVQGESHAWVEVWLGGWWGYDPTGLVPAGERHVVVARGRDYTDVPPFKGVYAGGGTQHVQVGVEVTRLS